MSMLRGVVLAVLAAAFAAFGLGFFGFAEGVRAAQPPDPAPEVDGIVALTGGSQERLATGVRLLREARGRRLLISGVNPSVRDRELFTLLAVEDDLARCCIDLGRAAEDTLGNASETAVWAQRNGFRAVIVVTDDYHMPRSLAELRLAMPDVRLVAYPVPTRWTDPQLWRTDLRAARRLGGEYVKYLTIRFREVLLQAEQERAAAAKAKDA